VKERSLRDLFHLIEQVLPEEQQLVSVLPETSIADALKLMQKHGFNQLPVMEPGTGEIYGVFSYRSFAEGVMKLPPRVNNPLSLPVAECLEQLTFAQMSDELRDLLDEFEITDAVLVGSRDRLLAIVTSIDVLRYFYRVASPYILLREIELAVRELIKASVDPDGLRSCIDACLKRHYEETARMVPTAVEGMSSEDYVTVLKFKGTWGRFSEAFGPNQDVVIAKLASISGLRNDVFHFRRELTEEEYQILQECREWLLTRIRRAEARRRGATPDG